MSERWKNRTWETCSLYAKLAERAKSTGISKAMHSIEEDALPNYRHAMAFVCQGAIEGHAIPHHAPKPFEFQIDEDLVLSAPKPLGQFFKSLFGVNRLRQMQIEPGLGRATPVIRFAPPRGGY